MMVNPMYDVVTRRLHEEDMRRAEEFRMVQEARERTVTSGVLARFFDRLIRHDKVVVERVPEGEPRPAL